MAGAPRLSFAVAPGDKQGLLEMIRIDSRARGVRPAGPQSAPRWTAAARGASRTHCLPRTRTLACKRDDTHWGLPTASEDGTRRPPFALPIAAQAPPLPARHLGLCACGGLPRDPARGWAKCLERRPSSSGADGGASGDHGCCVGAPERVESSRRCSDASVVSSAAGGAAMVQARRNPRFRKYSRPAGGFCGSNTQARARQEG